MKYINLIALFYLFIIFLTACNEKKIEKNGDKELTYYQNGIIKKLIIYDAKSRLQTIFLFSEKGQIQEIRHYNINGEFSGEQLWFYPDEVLYRKLLMKEGKANGNAYYFYDTVGTLLSHRYFRNDKQVFHGTDYWEDSIGITQSSLYYNDSGEIYYKRNFDKNGNLKSEEGRKP